MRKKAPKLFINGKDTRAMRDMDEFKRHGGRAFHSIFISTSRAETAVAAEGDELEFTAGRTAVHSPAKVRIATV